MSPILGCDSEWVTYLQGPYSCLSASIIKRFIRVKELFHTLEVVSIELALGASTDKHLAGCFTRLDINKKPQVWRQGLRSNSSECLVVAFLAGATFALATACAACVFNFSKMLDTAMPRH